MKKLIITLLVVLFSLQALAFNQFYNCEAVLGKVNAKNGEQPEVCHFKIGLDRGLRSTNTDTPNWASVCNPGSDFFVELHIFGNHTAQLNIFTKKNQYSEKHQFSSQQLRVGRLPKNFEMMHVGEKNSVHIVCEM